MRDNHNKVVHPFLDIFWEKNLKENLRTNLNI